MPPAPCSHRGPLALAGLSGMLFPGVSVCWLPPLTWVYVPMPPPQRAPSESRRKPVRFADSWAQCRINRTGAGAGRQESTAEKMLLQLLEPLRQTEAVRFFPTSNNGFPYTFNECLPEFTEGGGGTGIPWAPTRWAKRHLHPGPPPLPPPCRPSGAGNQGGNRPQRLGHVPELTQPARGRISPGQPHLEALTLCS